jgi:hypothetical protein
LLPAAGFLLSIVVSLNCTSTKKLAGSFCLVLKAPLGVWGSSCVAILSSANQPASKVCLFINVHKQKWLPKLKKQEKPF